MAECPPPPDLREVTPRIFEWKSGVPIIRVYDHAHEPTAMHPGQNGNVVGRFHFFRDPQGRTVPVLYGSDQVDGAIAETVFHDVPVLGEYRVVLESRLDSLSIVWLAPSRALRLVELFGHGLRRLGVRASQLTDTEASEYVRTVAWAEVFYRELGDVDGLIWVSRQFNVAKACVLFGGRLDSGQLTITGAPWPLRYGPGRDLVDQAAVHAGITIV